MVTSKVFFLLVLSILTDCQFLSRVKRNQCKKGQFQCQSRECVSESVVCDGTKNCNDGSDETKELCSSLQCPSNLFRCDYGACIEGNLKCNGENDCADNSDEELFTCQTVFPPKPPSTGCKKNEFPCKEGTCIGMSDVCDGNKSCPDGSDETFEICGTLSCTSSNFKCSYGACIELRKKCDGTVDCIDGSDERSSTCNAPDNSEQPSVIPSTLPRPSQGTNIFFPTENSTVCLFPEPPENGSIDIVGSEGNVRIKPGTPVGKFGVINYFCNPGYLNIGYSTAYCERGRWVNKDKPKPPQCIRMCKEINFPGVIADCDYRGDRVDCSQPVPEGTFATMSCREHYSPPIDDRIQPYATCRYGEWSGNGFKCYPVCGKPSLHSETLLISGGINTTVVEYPWHVALYLLKSDNTLKYICGGTIISPFVVLSAAHCFHPPNLGRLPPHLLKVVAGKTHIDFNYNEEGRAEFNVREIIIHPRYNHRSSFFRYDFAFMDLTSEIRFNANVKPICLESPPGSTLSLDTIGTIVGWGATENKSYNPILQLAQMPYINFTMCSKAVDKTFLPFLTDDKFCAKYINDVGVQPGDSGGSYMIKKNDLFYIVGIVSVKPNAGNSVALFTDIKRYLSTIISVQQCLNIRREKGFDPQQQTCEIQEYV